MESFLPLCLTKCMVHNWCSKSIYKWTNEWMNSCCVLSEQQCIKALLSAGQQQPRSKWPLFPWLFWPRPHFWHCYVKDLVFRAMDLPNLLLVRVSHSCLFFTDRGIRAPCYTRSLKDHMLASYVCCDKLPQFGGLKQYECIIPQFWRSHQTKVKCQQGGIPFWRL